MADRVVIVGAGQAGQQAAASLRDFGFAGDIRLVGDEPWLPYQRPPLSKTYLVEETGPEKTFLRAEKFYTERNIALDVGRRVTAIDRGARTIRLDDGRDIAWDHMVLATGTRNRLLTLPGADLDGVVTLRGLDDAHGIRRQLKGTRRIVIVGGGVIGLEISALARGAGIDADVVELGDRLAARVGSEALSAYFLAYHRAIGTSVHLGASLASIDGCDGRVVGVTLADGRRLDAQLVLVSIGVIANTEVAAAAGIEVKDGILVDAHMRSSDPAILAVGDCARFAPPFGPVASMRFESVQNAVDQGKCAAATIAGKPSPYDALPWFWSDQGKLKLQIAGGTQGHDQSIVKADADKGTLAVYCFAGGQLIGVECVNRPADFMAARRLLAQRRAITPADVDKPAFELKSLLA